MSGHNALIVDDEPDIRELLEITLGRMSISTHCAANIAQAKELLKKHSFDLCLTDMRLPDGNGLELVQLMQKEYPTTPIAMLTAYGSIDIAISALKSGAFDFVSKPVELSRLRTLVQTALKIPKLAKTTAAVPKVPLLLGGSVNIKKLTTQIAKLARSQAPVYIHGESGSGKELVARSIHVLGPRSDAPFVPVNCGAIPTELMESEFFGHKKGSFTGAHEDKEGLFQAANGGTLFLDEVADLPLNMQVKLLRAIQEKAVRPIGAQKEVSVDVRILSATHKDLAKQVDEGKFRQDLFYRINVIQINVPPLRERQEDIALLANYFLDKFAQDWEMEIPKLSKAAQNTLAAYSFPGNVRELENILERAITLCDDAEIQPAHLQLPEDGSTTTVTTGQHLPGYKPGEPLEEYLTEIEKQAILTALDATRWNRTAAAKRLGMTFRSLRYRLKKLGLDDSDDEEEPETP